MALARSLSCRSRNDSIAAPLLFKRQVACHGALQVQHVNLREPPKAACSRFRRSSSGLVHLVDDHGDQHRDQESHALQVVVRAQHRMQPKQTLAPLEIQLNLPADAIPVQDRRRARCLGVDRREQRHEARHQLGLLIDLLALLVRPLADLVTRSFCGLRWQRRDDESCANATSAEANFDRALDRAARLSLAIRIRADLTIRGG